MFTPNLVDPYASISCRTSAPVAALKQQRRNQRRTTVFVQQRRQRVVVRVLEPVKQNNAATSPLSPPDKTAGARAERRRSCSRVGRPYIQRGRLAARAMTPSAKTHPAQDQLTHQSVQPTYFTRRTSSMLPAKAGERAAGIVVLER